MYFEDIWDIALRGCETQDLTLRGGCKTQDLTLRGVSDANLVGTEAGKGY